MVSVVKRSSVNDHEVRFTVKWRIAVSVSFLSQESFLVFIFCCLLSSVWASLCLVFGMCEWAVCMFLHVL